MRISISLSVFVLLLSCATSKKKEEGNNTSAPKKADFKNALSDKEFFEKGKKAHKTLDPKLKFMTKSDGFNLADDLEDFASAYENHIRSLIPADFKDDCKFRQNIQVVYSSAIDAFKETLEELEGGKIEYIPVAPVKIDGVAVAYEGSFDQDGIKKAFKAQGSGNENQIFLRTETQFSGGTEKLNGSLTRVFRADVDKRELIYTEQSSGESRKHTGFANFEAKLSAKTPVQIGFNVDAEYDGEKFNAYYSIEVLSKNKIKVSGGIKTDDESSKIEQEINLSKICR